MHFKSDRVILNIMKIISTYLIKSIPSILDHLRLQLQNFLFLIESGITVEQREKLVNQKKQYIDAKLKLEDQLLKLKEEREDLKERGNKHEDKIMRDNAKLQVIEKT